jgi:hypothetical protein
VALLPTPPVASGAALGRPVLVRLDYSTAPAAAAHLSTKVDDRLFLVDNRVDSVRPPAYCPTSALLLRPVNG